MNEGKETNNGKSNKTVVVVLIVLLLLAFLLMVAAAGIGFFVWKKYSDQKERQVQALEQQIRNIESAYGNSRNVPSQSSNQEISSSENQNSETQSTSACPQNFTNEENLNKADWKTYSNAKYGYSFKYPKEWTITGQENDRVSMEDAGGDISFSWNSEDMTAFDYMGYKITSEKNIAMACQSAKETFLSADLAADPPGEVNRRIIFIDFKKSGKRHLLTYGYQDIGASISSDIVEQFDLILKTTEFNK